MYCIHNPDLNCDQYELYTTTQQEKHLTIILAVDNKKSYKPEGIDATKIYKERNFSAS